jgi:hypothetical protein
MSDCPYCSAQITLQISKEGGYCPYCDELILGDWKEIDITEEVESDDTTEELEITQQIFVEPDIKISEENTENHILVGEENKSAVTLTPKVVLKQDDLVEDDNNIRGYILEDEEESSEELLELPIRASLGKPKREDPSNNILGKKGVLFSLVAVLFIGFIGAYSFGFFETGDVDDVSSTESLATPHYVPEIKTVQPEKKVVRNRSTGKRKQQTKSSGSTTSNYKAIEETTVGGITTFKSSGPVLSRPKLKSTANKSASAKLQEDIADLQRSLRYCHTKALKRDPSVRGKWQVSFTVVEIGKAEGVQVKNLREKHKSMESCMKTRVEGFTFSKLSSSSFQKFSISFG